MIASIEQSRRPVRASVATGLAVLLTACSSSLDLPSITGLWVGAAGVTSSATTELALDVVYVGDVQEGCWSADGPDGVLPVRWPAGTVVGLEAALEVGELTVPDGAPIIAQGVSRAAPDDGDLEGDALPDGCDVTDGFYDLSDVAAG